MIHVQSGSLKYAEILLLDSTCHATLSQLLPKQNASMSCILQDGHFDMVVIRWNRCKLQSPTENLCVRPSDQDAIW